MLTRAKRLPSAPPWCGRIPGVKTATKKRTAKPAKLHYAKANQPKRAKPKAKGKPTIHQRAKAAGIDTSVPEARKPLIVIDHDWDPEADETPGRPTMLTPELGGRVCSLIAQRVPLLAIEKLQGMPSERTIYRWLAADAEGERGKLYDAFRQAFTRARELRAETRAEAIEYYVHMMTDPDTPAAQRLDSGVVRVAIEAQRVLMEIENRARYGKQVKVVGDPRQPIGVVQSKALSDAELLAIATGGMDEAER